MVRIVSQNFSPQRSRHSSGETDSYLAERTKSALGLGFSAIGKKRLDLPECESSSDSFWESEHDGDHQDAPPSELGEEEEDDINGNEALKKSTVQTKRKERRRERNKLSAQAYRQRRRSQNMKEQQQLVALEAENKRLHTLVEDLEMKTEQTKQYLRGCATASVPDFLLSLPSPAPSRPDRMVSEERLAGVTASASADALSPCPPSPASAASHHSSPPTPPTTEECLQPLHPQLHQHQQFFSPLPRTARPTVQPVPNINLQGQGRLVNSNNNNNNINSSAAAASSPSPQPQIVVNVNAQAVVQPSPHHPGNVNAPIPATLMIPVEYSTHNTQAVAGQNINKNLQAQTILLSSPIQATAVSTTVLADDRLQQPQVASAATPSMFGAIMWSINGNPAPPAAVYSLMNLELCNNNNNGNTNINSTTTTPTISNVVASQSYHHQNKGNINDTLSAKGSQSPGGNTCLGAAAFTSPVTVNLNEVKVSGEPLQMWAGQPLPQHFMHGAR